MKQREERQSVFIQARMRWDGGWQSANVRNISRHGMLINMPDPPSPGTYVEVQVGPITHAARTIWSSGLACGLRSREALDLGVLRGGRRTAPARTAGRPAVRQAAQGYQPPAQQRHEESRWLASMIQYGTFVAVALTCASAVAWEIHQTLSASTSAVGAVLDRKD